MATPQRSMWDTGWSATDELKATPAAPAPAPASARTPPAPAATSTARPPAAPAATPSLPAPNQSNAAVIADLARQARAARNDLQVANEQFARRALAMFEALRVVDAALVDLAVRVLGNEVVAATWFASRNLHFVQRAPLEMLTLGDRQTVVNELLRLEHGVY